MPFVDLLSVKPASQTCLRLSGLPKVSTKTIGQTPRLQLLAFVQLEKET